VRAQLVAELVNGADLFVALAGVQYRAVLLGAPWLSEVPVKRHGAAVSNRDF